MKGIARRTILLAATAAVALAITAAPAMAHTQKTVGAYQLTVGWGGEPAYAGQLNSVQLVIADAATGKPYTKLTDTLKADRPVRAAEGRVRTHADLRPRHRLRDSRRLQGLVLPDGAR